MISICSIVTEKTIKEFQFLKFSLEQYHDCFWYLACDSGTLHRFSNEKNIECHHLIESDDCDHNLPDQDKKDRWMKVMMTKFDICQIALSNINNSFILFLDCDMVFVNPIEQNIIKLMNSKNIDAMICQHMTNNWMNEAKHGYFNAGMFFVRNKEFLVEWQKLSRRYKQLNLYFEQKPLEFVQRNFVTLNLPINYNIGWWRFNEPNTKGRLTSLTIKNEENNSKIYFGSHKAINFHMHVLRELETVNFGQFLVDVVLFLLQSGSKNSKKYKELIDYYRNLKNEPHGPSSNS